MPRKTAGVTFATVRQLAKGLPDVEEGTAWGVPALKIRGRFFACMASHKSAEPNTLVILMSFQQRDAMIEDDPETYYLKPHYVNYPCVLVRLSKVRREALKDLLHAGWKFVAASAPKRKRSSMRRRAGA